MPHRMVVRIHRRRDFSRSVERLTLGRRKRSHPWDAPAAVKVATLQIATNSTRLIMVPPGRTVLLES